MKGIYFITDSINLLKQVLPSGISAVQWRNKKEINFETVKEMKNLCSLYKIPFIINDRVDLAWCLDADGVHLGQNDFPIRHARLLLGAHKIIGATALTYDEACEVINQGADYVGLGHIFPTQTKVKQGAPLGICTVKKICQKASFPIIAVGGIKHEHVEELKQAGASGLAICSAISKAPSPHHSATKFVKQWNGIYIS